MGQPDDGLADRIAAAVLDRLGPRIAENRGRLDDLHECVRRLEAKLAAEPVPAPPPAPACDVTWSRLCDIYWGIEQRRLEAKSKLSELRALKRLIGDRLVAISDGNTVREFRDLRFKETTVRGKAPATKTVNNETVTMFHVTKWAVRQNPRVIPIDPFASMTLEDLLDPVQNTRLNIVDDDPAAPLSLAHFISQSDELDRAIVLAAHSTGMRRGELARLEESWIDRRIGPDGKPLRLVWIPPGVSKGRRGRKKARVTILSEEALRAIDSYRRTLPLLLQRRQGSVFVNPETGRPYHPDTLTTRFKRLQRRAGAEGPSGPVWLHDLRRSFITLTLRRGEDAKKVADLAGHSSLQSQERYHVRSIRESILLRDRIEKARAEDLASLAAQRAGPHRAAVDYYDRDNVKVDLDSY